MLPEIILFPPTSIGHAHVSSHSHLSPQTLDTSKKLNLQSVRKGWQEVSTVTGWLVFFNISIEGGICFLSSW